MTEQDAIRAEIDAYCQPGEQAKRMKAELRRIYGDKYDRLAKEYDI